MRQRATSASPMEVQIGFSRAVRVGTHIAVSGTAPIGDDGTTVGVGDVAVQARRCLTIAFAALEQVGAREEDTVRTRVMLCDIGRWAEAAAVHGELFGDVRPACTFVEVSRFIDPVWLIEIEIDAVAET